MSDFHAFSPSPAAPAFAMMPNQFSWSTQQFAAGPERARDTSEQSDVGASSGKAQRPSGCPQAAGRMCSCETCGQPAVWCVCDFASRGGGSAVLPTKQSQQHSRSMSHGTSSDSKRSNALLFGLPCGHRTGSWSDLKVLGMTNGESESDDICRGELAAVARAEVLLQHPLQKSQQPQLPQWRGLMPADRVSSFSDLKVLLMTEPVATQPDRGRSDSGAHALAG